MVSFSDQIVYKPEGHIIAFMDIGTNSIRLLLVRINPNQSNTIISDQKEIVRLGEGEFIEQQLQPQAMQRAITVCHRFAEMARSNQAEQIIAVATAATREAENRDEFIHRLKREAQLEVRIVSGKEEARLIFLGVSSGVHLADHQSLFVDIGGGSTEVIWGNQREYFHLDSLKLGAIRLTSLFFLPQESAAVTPVRYAVIRQYVSNAALRTVQQLQGKQIDFVLGSSGTLENLADIAIYHFYKRPRNRDDILTYPQLKQTIEMLCALPLEERRKVPGITPSRADIIIAGAAIIDTLMEELGQTELHISERGLRDGLLIDFLSRSGQAPLFSGASVRERSIFQLGRTCNFDESHARHVTHLALELYDCTRELKFHNFGCSERELLEYTALLHDVGTFLSYNNHQAHSYYLIRNTDLLGFDQTEITIMATAALFHRKTMPNKKKNPEFAALSKPQQKIVRLFAVLLRISESMDRSHQSVVKHVQLRKKNIPNADWEVVLEIYTDQDVQLELWGIQNQGPIFEKAFKRKMTIEVLPLSKAKIVEMDCLSPRELQLPGQGYSGNQSD